MKISEIINENQQSLWGDDPWPIDIGPRQTSKDGLKSFRRLSRGPEHISKTDFGDENIAVPQNSKTNTKKQNDDNIGKTGTLYYTQIANTSKFNGANEFYDNFYNEVSSLGFENEFYVMDLGTDKEWTCGKIKTKAHSKIVELIFGKTRNSNSLDSKTFNTIRLHSKKGSEDREKLKVMLADRGMSFNDGSFLDIKFDPIKYNAVMELFWDIISNLDGLDLQTNRGSGAGSLIAGKKVPRNYYLYLAENIYIANKRNQGWALSRGGGIDSGTGGYDRYDELIIMGITAGGVKQINDGRPAYREHAVPADLINEMGIKICQKYPKTNGFKNKVVTEVADMIQRNLSVVLCSSPPRDNNNKPIPDSKNPTEQEIVDSKYRTTMPDGWKDGDSILERFTASGIQVYSYKSGGEGNGKRIAE
jgi:hypothetical protein